MYDLPHQCLYDFRPIFQYRRVMHMHTILFCTDFHRKSHPKLYFHEWCHVEAMAFVIQNQRLINRPFNIIFVHIYGI